MNDLVAANMRLRVDIEALRKENRRLLQINKRLQELVEDLSAELQQQDIEESDPEDGFP